MALPTILTKSRPLSTAIRHFCSSSDQGVVKIVSDASHLSRIKREKTIIEDPHTSLICNQEISDRRTRLIQHIINYNDFDKCLLIIPAARQTYMAGSEIPNYNMKQSSDFIYLSGLNLIKSLDSILVLIGGKQEITKSILFTSFHDAHKNLWLGSDLIKQSRRPIDGLFDEVKSIEELNEMLNRYSNLGYNKGATRFFLQTCDTNGPQTSLRKQVLKYLQLNLHNKDRICNISTQLDKMRFIKSKSELNAMRRASYIGSKSMSDTIRWAQNYLRSNSSLNECQLVGRYEFETRLRGSTKLSFWPVCASMDRATTIHYSTNDQNITEGDWVVMDAGCEEFDGYISDITRSFPISPRNSRVVGPEKLRYELFEGLNDLHSRLLKFTSNNRPCLDELHRHMLKMISELLLEFRPFVNQDQLNSSDCLRLASKYCPHHVSHYLGLDLHDTPTIPRSTSLTKGVCFTIEPGLYFPSTDESLKKEFRGIGYRIEDDCAINEEDQLEVLSKFVDHDLAFNLT